MTLYVDVQQDPDTLQWTYNGQQIEERRIVTEELRTGHLRTDPEFQVVFQNMNRDQQKEQEEHNKQVVQAGGVPNPKFDFDNVDWDFIKANEGFETTGYVPMNKDGTAKGHSGVTVASGFDLGSRTKESLKGLPEELVTKLEPFLGLKKDAAIQKAAELSLTEGEANTIDQWAKKSTMERIDKAWKKATGMSFKHVPKNKATPIVDVVFNHGLPATMEYNFWKQVTTNQWEEAEANLRNFSEKDPDLQPRRTRGADYMKKYSKPSKGTRKGRTK